MVPTESLAKTALIYPESDGQPMADNTKQYRWIVRLAENLKHLFAGQNIFVAADLFWYPVEGQTTIVTAPDVFVVIGRAAGDRGSYKQWEEDNIAPQVVFEIVSPSNKPEEIRQKEMFYLQHGVLEIYFYNPETDDFWGLVRSDRSQLPGYLLPLNLPWKSPLLGIRFAMDEQGLAVFYPDNRRFADPQDWADKAAQLQQTEAERDAALQALATAQQERDRAWAKLRQLGIDPEQL